MDTRDDARGNAADLNSAPAGPALAEAEGGEFEGDDDVEVLGGTGAGAGEGIGTTAFTVT